jgi:hypothetical protein
MKKTTSIGKPEQVMEFPPGKSSRKLMQPLALALVLVYDHHAEVNTQEERLEITPAR